MDREAFVAAYMEGTPYTIDGEVVHSPENYTSYALECRCGEEGCDGWAMVPHGSHNWHKFMNGLTQMTYEEAMAADRAARKEL